IEAVRRGDTEAGGQAEKPPSDEGSPKAEEEDRAGRSGHGEAEDESSDKQAGHPDPSWVGNSSFHHPHPAALRAADLPTSWGGKSLGEKGNRFSGFDVLLQATDHPSPCVVD